MTYTSDNLTTIWLNVYNQVYNSMLESNPSNCEVANKKAVKLANKTVNQFSK